MDEWGRRLPWARGIIALGDRAIGFFAMGGLAIGILAFGGLGFGLFAVGGLAVGIALAFGGGAIGGVAIGGGAAGGIAFGGGAAGYYACGGAADGVHVYSGDRQDPEAARFFSRFVKISPAVRSAAPAPPFMTERSEPVLRELRKDPDLSLEAQLFYDEGMTAFETGDFQKAAELLSRVPREHPDYAKAMRYVGYRIYVREWNKPLEGLPYLDRAYEAAPNDQQVLDDAVAGYKKAGRAWNPK
jgi:tetratricopeptide (TPR) repeat protein